MATISALTELVRADIVDSDWLVIVDGSAGSTKKLQVDSLLGALDGDQLDIDFTPTNYTPDATPAQADDVDDLAAHLYGIDVALGIFSTNEVYQTAATDFTVSDSSTIVVLTTGAGAATQYVCTLPSAVTVGSGHRIILFCNDQDQTDSNRWTIYPSDTNQTIGNMDLAEMGFYLERLEIVSDGSDWRIVGWQVVQPEMFPIVTWASNTSFSISSAFLRLPKGKGSYNPWCRWRGAKTINFTPTNTGWHKIAISSTQIDDDGCQNYTTNWLSCSNATSFGQTVTWATDDQMMVHGATGGNRVIFMFYVSTIGAIDKFYTMNDKHEIRWATPNSGWHAAAGCSTWTVVTGYKTTFISDLAPIMEFRNIAAAAHAVGQLLLVPTADTAYAMPICTHGADGANDASSVTYVPHAAFRIMENANTTSNWTVEIVELGYQFSSRWRE